MSFAPDHVATNRRYWDEQLAKWFGARARRHWAAGEPFWGIWCVPQSQLPVLPDDVAGMDVVELGCGTGYVSAWLAQRGARPVGVDNSARQLATAREMQAEFRRMLTEDLHWAAPAHMPVEVLRILRRCEAARILKHTLAPGGPGGLIHRRRAR